MMKALFLVGSLFVASAAFSSNNSIPHLQYYGGPLIEHPEIYTVYWGANPYSDLMDQYFNMTTKEPFFDPLKEYSTPIYSEIGAGSFVKRIQLGIPDKRFVNPDDIDELVVSLAENGTVPLGTSGDQYAVNNISQAVVALILRPLSMDQCEYCGYHSNTAQTKTNTILPYMVLSGIGANCSPHLTCNFADTPLHSLMTIASHELNELRTDPFPRVELGWVDLKNGEIADICEGIIGQIEGQYIQATWSNQQKGCVFPSYTAISNRAPRLHPLPFLLQALFLIAFLSH